MGGQQSVPRPGTGLGARAPALGCHTEPCLQQVAWGPLNTPQLSAVPDTRPHPWRRGSGPSLAGRGALSEGQLGGAQTRRPAAGAGGSRGNGLGTPSPALPHVRASARSRSQAAPSSSPIGSAGASRSSTGIWGGGSGKHERAPNLRPDAHKRGHQGPGRRGTSLRAKLSLFASGPVAAESYAAPHAPQLPPPTPPIPSPSLGHQQECSRPHASFLVPCSMSKTHCPARRCPVRRLSQLPQEGPRSQALSTQGWEAVPCSATKQAAGSVLTAPGRAPRERLAHTPRAHAATGEQHSRAGWLQFPRL